MTTIAYRNGTIAADTQGVKGDTRVHYPTSKIFRLTHGEIFGITGAYDEGHTLLRWAEAVKHWDDHDPVPKVQASCFVLLSRSRLLELYDSHIIPVYLTPESFLAFGSGAPFALGALWMSASAQEAVSIGASLDLYSGGEIETLELPSEAKGMAVWKVQV